MTLQATPAPFDASKGAEGLPMRFRVLPWGDNQTTKGQVILNETSLANFAAFMESQNWDEVPLDFEHNCVRSSPTYDPQGKVAGYGKIELCANDGAYLVMSSWTADGRTLAGGGHFKDLSATVILNAANEVLGIHSVALCKHGATPGAIFLSAWPVAAEKMETPEDLHRALIAALQMPHNATPKDVVEALLTKFKSMPTEPTPPENKPETPDLGKSLETLTATVTSLAATVKGLADGLEAMKEADVERQKEGMMAAAAAEGKQVPASAKALSVDALKTLCSELPVTVPLERRTPHHSVQLSGAPAGLDPSISRITGVSDEDRKKYGVL